MKAFSKSIRAVTVWLFTVAVGSAMADAQPWFVEVSSSSGLDYVHFNGMSGQHYFSEMMGPGGALFDYDNDGDLDLYLVQGAMLGPGKTPADALFPPPSGQVLGDRLFRNDLKMGVDGRPVPSFTDVTEEAGIHAPGYGMGVASGDFDNDGWIDLYVTNFGHNQLWRNRGDGTFEDLTARSGVDDNRWSVSAAFFDYDRDGWLDLYVGNYVNFSMANHKRCQVNSSAQDYCSPLTYDALPDRLFRNRGDGSFEDVTAKTRIIREFGGALGIVVGDFNGDDWPDLYVANDGTPNQLWMNQGDGTFRNDALLAGAAVNMEGNAEASMGVDAADFDGDGDEDLFMTHLLGETNTIYVNDGEGWFEDRSLALGLAAPSKGYTSFGTGWFDYDNDGWLDIFIANGEVKTIPALAKAGDPYPLHQPNQLFRNIQGRRFDDVTAPAGPVFELSEVSRGVAFGDVDNDGDTDIVVLNNNGPVRLLVNEIGNRSHWVGLRLVDEHGRDALGARVRVFSGSAPTGVWRRVGTAGSYASANDPRVLMGLDGASAAVRVEVVWPNGRREHWKGLATDRYWELRQGTGAETKVDHA